MRAARIALATALLSGCTFEQLLIGQRYTIYTPPASGCPGLAWRFVVDAQRGIGGFVSRDGLHPLGSLSGLLNADDSFRMTVAEGAGRTAEVTGQFTSQVSTISIRGDALGGGCDGQTFSLRLGGYFSRAGGGGGGGG